MSEYRVSDGTESAKEALHHGFILTDDGRVLVQVPDAESQWGFHLASDDQTWDGGIGIARTWETMNRDDHRITPEDHEQLDWLLDI